MKLRFSASQLYFYLVCFIMLITVIVGLTNLVRAGIEVFLPVSGEGIFYKDIPRPAPFNENFSYQNSKLPSSLIEREIEAQQTYQQAQQKTNSLRQAIQQLFRGLSQVLIAFPVYLYHWRRIPLLS
jgi:hypothetical protein